ncbi:MAG TPA: hypothetical protein VHM26_06160 [Chitinophagaceae bacterium]|jgi:hypothetical protein|nr:hypothetical protein [Chitinophagaceae bacterium]
MFNWIIWIWAWLCPNPNHTLINHGNCTLIHGSTYSTLDGDDDGDSGDETGNFPPKPPVPPPPPPPPPPGGG